MLKKLTRPVVAIAASFLLAAVGAFSPNTANAQQTGDLDALCLGSTCYLYVFLIDPETGVGGWYLYGTMPRWLYEEITQ